MDDVDPTPRRPTVEAEALSRVATLVRTATRHANRAAGSDLHSPWLDVLSECVTAAGHLSDVADLPERDVEADGLGGQPAVAALAALAEAAKTLDRAGGRRDHRAVMVRAALTDAIAIARRNQP